jgi:peptidyl-tRNA hydrolase, PTH1 family
MPLIVGLGNPGSEYSGTPHNIGFEVVSKLAERNNVAFKKGPVSKSLEARFPSARSSVILFKPLSFMNLSGECVAAALHFYKLTPADLLVICDDVNLSLGYLRFRIAGGSGGQKGLKSIISILGTDEFLRLRLGVGGGEPGADVAKHVLSKFLKDESKQVTTMIETAADAIQCFLDENLETAMNRFNTKKEKNISTNPSDESISPDK